MGETGSAGALADISAVLGRVEGALVGAGVAIVSRDLERPWGGFLVLSETDLPTFLDTWFPGASMGGQAGSIRLSPKMLIVAPGRRLSWQYHRRRGEIWRVVEGPVAISRSATDVEPAMATYGGGEIVRFELGERHRLAGLESWGVVAEIWQHADPEQPSDELDIVRLADDHHRV
jgi:mannose-6-phosphate isomerase